MICIACNRIRTNAPGSRAHAIGCVRNTDRFVVRDEHGRALDTFSTFSDARECALDAIETGAVPEIVDRWLPVSDSDRGIVWRSEAVLE